MASQDAVIGRLVGWVTPAREADWDALYAEQLPRIYNYFRFRVGDGPDAEDLTSMTFEKAWSARHRYRRDLAGFSTWLMTIARRTAIDHWRARRDLRPIEEAHGLAGGDDPGELAERRSDFERLTRLLETLPERDREMIALKYGAGLTHRAIGRQVGLSESNVGTVLHRRIEELRAAWTKGE
jgi:RNA polymerase sigma-70 factor (ECF subfamily)